MKTEKDLIQVFQRDAWMMEILAAVQSLELPDWWVCAGFIRSIVWDMLHGFEARTPLPDIDVIYFDPSHLEEAVEKRLEETLRRRMPDLPWSVKNQARMHLVNGIAPYLSAVDAISKFPETVTSLGITLDGNDNIVLTAPWGVHDLLHMQVRPTPYFAESKELAGIYEERMAKKQWKNVWPHVNIARVL